MNNYTCKICSKICESSNSLNGHQRSHKKIKNSYVSMCCSLLTKKEVRVGSLNAHEKAYLKHLKNCLNCGTEFSANKKFCTQTCAATYTNRHRIRKPVSEIGRQNIATANRISKKNRKIYAYSKVYFTNCKHCHKIFTSKSSTKKLCSDNCRSKNQALNALKQINTGYGKTGYHKGFYCQSRFELCYVIWCIDNNKNIVRNKETFSYIGLDNKEHIYNPDFIVDGKLIEIKGRVCAVDHIKFKSVENLVIIFSNEAKTYVNYVMNKYKLRYNELETLYEDYVPPPDTRDIIQCKECNKDFRKNTVKGTFCSQSCCGRFNRKLNLTTGKSGWFSKVLNKRI